MIYKIYCKDTNWVLTNKLDMVIYDYARISQVL
jgi:hypothetical protein